MEYLDIRDLGAELEELSDQIADGEEPLTDEERDRYEELVALKDQLGELNDWRFGPTLIREDYFEEYAQQFAEEVGAIPEDNSWPVYCIDWEWAARELAMDYTSVTFDGHDWLIR